jgi:acetyltransferase-like isoleucine patch superfamily enzyme
MEIYQCDKCKKSKRDDHIAKKNSCRRTKTTEHYCQECDNYFSRKDSLHRHLQSQKHCESVKKYKMTNGNKNNSIIGNHNTITNDKMTINGNNGHIGNNIIINYYNILSSFGREEINELTHKKIHNFGYADYKTRYHIIFKGETMVTTDILEILNDPLNSKQNDVEPIVGENNKTKSKSGLEFRDGLTIDDIIKLDELKKQKSVRLNPQKQMAK